MAKSKRFKEREQRMIDVAQGRIPDRVPICGLMETYALVYSQTPLKEAALSMRKNVHGHAKIYNDIFPLVWNSYIAKEKKFSIELLCRIKPYKAFFLQVKEYSGSKKAKYTLLELMMKINLPSSFVRRLGSLTTYKIKAFLFKGKRL